MKLRIARKRAMKSRILFLLRQPICRECGKRGKHWIQFNNTALDLGHQLFGNLFTNNLPHTNGFWICDKFYDSNGRRID